ncbi:MAG: hypothetical protein KIT45_06760 [Fimbriimonadia bacterium]|nr:hypothetical protein [Fimbriimonadia bacterium]
MRTIEWDYPEGSHWAVNDHLYTDYEVEEQPSMFDESYDLLMAGLEQPACSMCFDGLCMRCGGIPPCCDDCGNAGLCRWCNGTGVQDV